MEVSETPQTKHKSFVYKTATAWTDGKSGTLTSGGKPPLRVSDPPEFKGEPGVWTPEDLFVAAVEGCYMSTFLAYAAKKGLPIVSYTSHTNGVLEMVDGEYRFTRIVIFPTVVVSNASIEADVQRILRETQQHCLVSNSIDSFVEVTPTIVVQ